MSDSTLPLVGGRANRLSWDGIASADTIGALHAGCVNGRQERHQRREFNKPALATDATVRGDTYRMVAWCDSRESTGKNSPRRWWLKKWRDSTAQWRDTERLGRRWFF